MSVELEVVSKFCFLFLLVALAECLRANGMVWQKSATLSPQSDVQGFASRSTQTATGMVAVGEADADPRTRKEKKMKRVMFAAAVAATMFAMGDGVESGIVGYQQITIDKQYTILGCNFKNADNTEYAISNFIPYAEGMITAKNATDADQIQVRQPDTTYKIYFMCNGMYGKGSGTYHAELDKQWVNAEDLGSVTTDTISNGTGFWFVRPAADLAPITVTVAGGIEALSVKPVSLPSQYNIIANPYPVDMPVTNIPYASGMVTAKNATDADQIQVRQPDTTYKIYFMCNGMYGKGSGTYHSELDQKWVNSEDLGSVTTDSIPAGQGFWYIKANASADVTLTFNSPIK